MLGNLHEITDKPIQKISNGQRDIEVEQVAYEGRTCSSLEQNQLQ